MKKKGKGKNRNKTCRQEKKNNFKVVSKLWKELSYEKVSDWDALAHSINKNKNKKIYQSAYMLFMCTNINLLKVGSRPITECPRYMFELTQLIGIDFKIIKKETSLDIIFKYLPDLDLDNFIVLSATKPTKSKTIPDYGFKKIGVIDTSWNPGFKGSSVWGMYKDRFGDVDLEGKGIGFKIQVIEGVTGQASQPICVLMC